MIRLMRELLPPGKTKINYMPNKYEEDLISNPEYARAVAAATRYRNDVTYARFFRKLSMAGVDVERVKSLLVDSKIAEMDGIGVRLEKVRKIEDRPTIIATVAAAEEAAKVVQDEIDKELLSLMSAELYAELKASAGQSPDLPNAARNGVNAVQARLSYAGTSLTDQQYLQLGGLLEKYKPTRQNDLQISDIVISQAVPFFFPINSPS